MKSKIEKYLSVALNDAGIPLPVEFIEFWSQHYGKEVDVQLSDERGDKWNVDRVFHLEGRDEITDKTESWRHGDLEQLDYSVGYFESMMPNWEDHDKIFPFAGINTKDSAEFNLVTLDYTVSDEPRVSIWVHEKSFGYEEPFLVMISANFKHFIDQWNSD